MDNRKCHGHGKVIPHMQECNQGGGSGLGLTQNSHFNSCHGLFFPLTPIINTNTLSLKLLMNIFLTSQGGRNAGVLAFHMHTFLII